MTAKIKSHHVNSGYRHKPKGLSNKSFEKVYWPYIPMLALALFLVVMSVQNGLFASMVKHPTSRVLAYATNLSASDLLADANSDRAANSVPALKMNSELQRAAQAKANDMATKDYWSHNTPSGNPPWVFVQAQDYQYQKLGENLATGFSSSAATTAGWMASPEHRENMLDPAFTQVGFGYANIANYQAVGGGPMTIIVAFYGRPEVLADNSQNTPITVASSTPTNLPTQTASTNRAQIAFAKLPFGNYSTLVAVCGLILVAGFWMGRHALALRRAIVQGESFVMSHPLLDLGFLLLGLAFFALTRTVGLIQ